MTLMPQEMTHINVHEGVAERFFCTVRSLRLMRIVSCHIIGQNRPIFRHTLDLFFTEYNLKRIVCIVSCVSLYLRHALI